MATGLKVGGKLLGIKHMGDLGRFHGGQGTSVPGRQSLSENFIRKGREWSDGREKGERREREGETETARKRRGRQEM